MGWLEFISSIVKSITWPILAAFALVYFSKQIKELFSSLKEFSLSKDGFTGSFDRTVKETKRDIVAAKLEIATTLPPTSRQLLDQNEHPSGNAAQIVSEWNNVEKIVRDKLTHHGIQTEELGVSVLLQTAYDQNCITDNEYKSLLGLNTMRNLAVHSPTGEIDDKRTQEFLTLADAIKTVLYITNR